MRYLIASLILLSMAVPAFSRDRLERAHFMVLNPCPATGKQSGPCPGFVVDHIVPLCAGGADSVDNMQWQNYAESIIKDVEERRECSIRKGSQHED
jgi:hypothetical protein